MIPETLAQACYETHTLEDLEMALRIPAEKSDMDYFDLTETEWYEQMTEAYIKKLSDQYVNVDDTVLKDAVSAVEENNRLNDGAWNDWDSSNAIGEVYGIDIGPDESMILDRAIQFNGATLKYDLPAVEWAIWGQMFYNSLFDRA